MGKQRISVTVDSAVVDEARAAAKRSGSLSAWVADAIEEKVAKEHRLIAMGEALAAYEAEYGTISEEEARAQVEHDRANAIWVRRGQPVAKQ